jgi:hypothetical protein
VVTLWAALLSLCASTSTVAPILKAPFGLPPVPFTVEAERLVRENSTYTAEGKAILRRQDAVVFADRITFDEVKGIAIAEGNVTAIEGDAVMTCKRVEMKVPELIGGLESGELRIKADIPEPLLSRLSAQQLKAFGDDQMIVTADRMDRIAPREFEVKGGSFTVCDCGEDSTPSWRIDASKATVDLDSGAWMYWPVFYAKGVPIFALPVFYFPLGERRSGLLTPRPSYSAVTGPSIAQPVYFVLGDSWDLTVEGSYLSDRGAGAGLEVRWAPSAASIGELRSTLVLDFGERVGDGTRFDKNRSSPIPRYAIAARHRTQLEHHTSVNLEINALGDPVFLGDFADDFLARQVEGTRSRFTISSFLQENLRISGGFQLFQDLRPENYLPLDPDLREIALFSGELDEVTLLGPGAVRYRFAELRLDAPPYPLFDGVPLLAEATALIHAFAAPRPELARFLRADLRPGISLPISIFGLLTFEPSIAARITAWTGRFESAGIDSNRVAFVAKASLFTALWRDYGSVIHQVRPEVSYLLIPKVWGWLETPFATEDEVDQLSSAMQLRGRITNEFLLPSGARIGGFEIWFGRDFDIPWEDDPGFGNSEIVLRGDAPLTPSSWPVRLATTARLAVDPDDGAVTDLAANLNLFSKWITVGLGYEQLDDRPPTYAFVAPEELVPAGTVPMSNFLSLSEWRMRRIDQRLPYKPWSDFRGMLGSIRIQPIEGLALGFDIGLTFDDAASLEATYGNRSIIRDTRSTISWISPCDCWSAELVVSTARDRDHLPSVQLGLDLSRLGGGF